MPKPSDFTDDQLATLTEAELEGLKDTTIVSEGETDVVDHDAAADAAIEATKQPAPAPVPAAPQPDPAPALQQDAPAPTPAAPVAEQQPAPPPAPATDFAAQIATLKGQQQDLARKFDDGELTAAEFHEQRGALDDQLIEARMQQHDHTRRAADALDVYNNETVPNWLKQHETEYPVGSPPFVSLDYEVRRLQDEASRAGHNPYAKSILEQAHQNVSRYFGRPTPTPKPDDLPGRELPPNLSRVPAAGDNDDITDGGRWAHLSRLADSDPIAHEKAMAAMSEADRDAYLRAS